MNKTVTTGSKIVNFDNLDDRDSLEMSQVG